MISCNRDYVRVGLEHPHEGRMRPSHDEEVRPPNPTGASIGCMLRRQQLSLLIGVGFTGVFGAHMRSDGNNPVQACRAPVDFATTTTPPLHNS